eukprot:4641272-Alexandrium_andersonii.AAC.1
MRVKDARINAECAGVVKPWDAAPQKQLPCGPSGSDPTKFHAMHKTTSCSRPGRAGTLLKRRAS